MLKANTTWAVKLFRCVWKPEGHSTRDFFSPYERKRISGSQDLQAFLRFKDFQREKKRMHHNLAKLSRPHPIWCCQTSCVLFYVFFFSPWCAWKLVTSEPQQFMQSKDSLKWLNGTDLLNVRVLRETTRTTLQSNGTARGCQGTAVWSNTSTVRCHDAHIRYLTQSLLDESHAMVVASRGWFWTFIIHPCGCFACIMLQGPCLGRSRNYWVAALVELCRPESSAVTWVHDCSLILRRKLTFPQKSPSKWNHASICRSWL